jgi:hypothetical protein
MGAIGLREQFIFTYYSQLLLARLLMLRPMILLAVDATIFHEVTCTLLEFYFIHRRFAT